MLQQLYSTEAYTELLYFRLSFSPKSTKHAYNIHFICVIQVSGAVGRRKNL